RSARSDDAVADRFEEDRVRQERRVPTKTDRRPGEVRRAREEARCRVEADEAEPDQGREGPRNDEDRGEGRQTGPGQRAEAERHQAAACASDAAAPVAAARRRDRTPT